MKQTMSVIQAFKKTGQAKKGKKKKKKNVRSSPVFLAWNICILSHVPDDEMTLEARRHTSVSLIHQVNTHTLSTGLDVLQVMVRSSFCLFTVNIAPYKLFRSLVIQFSLPHSSEKFKRKTMGTEWILFLMQTQNGICASLHADNICCSKLHS